MMIKMINFRGGSRDISATTATLLDRLVHAQVQDVLKVPPAIARLALPLDVHQVIV